MNINLGQSWGTKLLRFVRISLSGMTDWLARTEQWTRTTAGRYGPKKADGPKIPGRPMHRSQHKCPELADNTALAKTEGCPVVSGRGPRSAHEWPARVSRRLNGTQAPKENTQDTRGSTKAATFARCDSIAGICWPCPRPRPCPSKPEGTHEVRWAGRFLSFLVVETVTFASRPVENKLRIRTRDLSSKVP